MKPFFYLLTILSLIACTATTEPSQEFLESSSSEKIKSSSSVETSSNSLSIYEAVKENEFYTTKDSVAAYLCRFGNLPQTM